MESYLLDWANLLLRWLHVITAIAWIGASFYFVMLDSSLEPPKDKESKDKGVGGELWAVHGGGFYNSQKYLLGPKVLPEHLHWSYWESYSTWLSGFALLSVSYLWNPSTYLIDKSRMDWSGPAAVVAALAFLAVFWLLYDGICRLFGQRDRVVGALVALLVAGAAWLACQLFAGRAAFVLVGAMMATSMSLNVFAWIIPGQRKNVAALRAGQPLDPVHGIRGKQRSVHNTYFTLPVLFSMLSGHYSFTYSHPHNWLVLLAMMAAGAAIRQFFVARHRYKLGLLPNPLPYALVGVALLAVVVVALAPRGEGVAVSTAKAAPVTYASVQPILAQRCYMCHGEQVQMKNVRLDTPAGVTTHAQALYQQVVVTKVMPLNNATGITDAERVQIKRWFEAGAPAD